MCNHHRHHYKSTMDPEMIWILITVVVVGGLSIFFTYKGFQ